MSKSTDIPALRLKEIADAEYQVFHYINVMGEESLKLIIQELIEYRSLVGIFTFNDLISNLISGIILIASNGEEYLDGLIKAAHDSQLLDKKEKSETLKQLGN